MRKKIHVVPHTHWDREWYFSCERGNVYLWHDLTEVIETLLKDEKMSFVLDAQTLILKDYLKYCPDQEANVSKLVKEKRLIIGPFATQSDLIMISGESIVRNLYAGIKYSQQFGDHMKVGYVIDSFGQGGNMPQIYQGFNIPNSMFMRGVSDEQSPKMDFIWQGDDGSQVLASYIPYGYYIGSFLPEDAEFGDFYWKMACLDKVGKVASTNNLYFSSGLDQLPIRKNLARLVQDRCLQDPENDYVVSNPEAYFEDVRKASPKLTVVQGELLQSKHSRVHRSIYSGRSDIKAMSTVEHNYLVNILEPFCSMNHMLGFDYPKGILNEIWELMFQNAAHDTACNCLSDSVNQDVKGRYRKIHELSTSLVEIQLRLLLKSIRDKKDFDILIVNTLPISRSQVFLAEVYLPGLQVEIFDKNNKKLDFEILEYSDVTERMLGQYLPLNPSIKVNKPEQIILAKVAIYKEEIPAFGYELLHVKRVENMVSTQREINYLENEYYKVLINKDGSLKVVDKLSGYQYDNQCILVDEADDGDGFNYSPSRNDWSIRSCEFVPQVELTGSTVYQRAVISFDLQLPSNLEHRANKMADVITKTQLIIGLAQNSKVIDVTLRVDNNVESHKMSLLVDSELISRFNYADEQFGCVRRENIHQKELDSYFEALKTMQIITKVNVSDITNPKAFKQAEKSWQEMPINIEPMQSYVALSNEERTVAVIPQGVREYQIIDDHIIKLTLFRTYGMMGKDNLLYRPGRASGESHIATPDAQLLGVLEFKCGIAYLQGEFNDGDVSNLAKTYNTDILSRTYAYFLNGRTFFALNDVENTNEANNSLMVTTNQLTLSTIKKAEEEKGYIIRFFNGKYQQTMLEKLVFNRKIEKAHLVNLLEERIAEVKQIDEHTLELENVDHCKFVSLYVETK